MRAPYKVPSYNIFEHMFILSKNVTKKNRFLKVVTLKIRSLEKKFSYDFKNLE